MDGIEGKIAKDMLKPASGVVDALLSAKIEKLKSWANNKDLESSIKDEKLQLVFESYVSRIIKRCSFLSTIVFPQRKIPLEVVYEKINLGGIQDVWTFEDETENCIIDIEEQGKCYLIIDNAGMGKSTYSKHFALTLLNNSEYIPILFDLAEFDSQLSLVDNLACSFDDIDSKFNRDMFKKLIVKG
jgi:hypothetical protein